jgi:AcrR family transcriptional regulator
MLHDALMSLVLKKGYDAVTIKDIVDEANVGRSTFYAHYNSKEELFRSGFEKLHTLLVEQQAAARIRNTELAERALGFSLAMFEHARDHKDIYHALVRGRGGAIALQRIRQLLLEVVSADLAANLKASPDASIHRELAAQYVVGAFMSVLTWWLDRKARLPSAEIDAVFRRLTLQGLMAAGMAPEAAVSDCGAQRNNVKPPLSRRRQSD